MFLVGDPGLAGGAMQAGPTFRLESKGIRAIFAEK